MGFKSALEMRATQLNSNTSYLMNSGGSMAFDQSNGNISKTEIVNNAKPIATSSGGEEKKEQVEKAKQEVKKRGSNIIIDTAALDSLRVDEKGRGPNTPTKIASKEHALDFEEAIVIPGKEGDKID